MRITYFGETKEEEVARIKELWKKSLLVFGITGVILAIADKSILAFLGGIAPFSWCGAFRHAFRRQGNWLVLLRI